MSGAEREEEGFPRGNPSPALPASELAEFERSLSEFERSLVDGAEPSAEPDPEPYPEFEPTDEELWPADGEPLVGKPPNLRGRGPKSRVRKLVAPQPSVPPPSETSPERRLLILDTWRRSGLPAGDFADLVGVSKHT